MSNLYLSQKPTRPILLFDGDCGFCRRWINFWRRITCTSVDYTPYQEAKFSEIPAEALERAVHFVETDGRCTSGAEAVFRLLAQTHRYRWLLWLYETVPGTRMVSNATYRWVADHRPFFSRWTQRLSSERMPASYWGVRRSFLRGLAGIYAIAFGSLAVQVIGLFGHQGILPTDHLMPQAKAFLHGQFYRFPTVAWFATSDLFLKGLCIGGVFLSTLAAFDVAPAILFFLLWAGYLSLVTIGGEFLSFQWDALLLEAGFLAFLWSPMRLGREEDSTSPPSWWILWLLRFLVFRLMLQSGLVKLLSHDATWAHWTALRVYYETMPLPNPLSWLMHQCPSWFQTVSVGFVFLAELILPWFIFGTRRLRHIAFTGFIALQLLIFLTGNYAFFNLLAIVLCLTLLEDADLGREGPALCSIERSRQPFNVRSILATGVFLTAIGKFVLFFGLHFPFEQMLAVVEPFRSVNNYGLFAVMTTTRPEIILEGSDDGSAWKPYEFRYKPQALDRRPLIVAPYQPRLDWQMWFAALGSYKDNPWFMRFCQQVLEGAPEVLKLLRTDPFPAHPPRYLRAMQYQYHFTTIEEHRLTGDWWKRELEGPYCPVLSLNK